MDLEKRDVSEIVIPQEIYVSTTTSQSKKKDSSPIDEIGFTHALKLFAPGTAIRTALDDILRANMGALIVIDKEGLLKVVDGGFRVNCRFSAQRLVELAKMDGAIILSEDLKKILYANTLLVPSAKIKTRETGTRHKAAERTSKQFKTIVVAISERKKKITLYYGEERYVLESGSEILRRSTETLQMLEKQKEIFSDLLSHLNVLEMNNLVMTSDICNVLQRMEIIKRISDVVKRYLIELGKEGTIISMRLKELTKNFVKDRDMILRDYFGSKFYRADASLNEMSFDFLLENNNLSRTLFEELHDRPISPRGLRVMSKTSLLEKDIKLLLNHFGTLDKIFDSSRDGLLRVFKNEDLVDALVGDLQSLREKILSGKRI